MATRTPPGSAPAGSPPSVASLKRADWGLSSSAPPASGISGHGQEDHPGSTPIRQSTSISCHPYKDRLRHGLFAPPAGGISGHCHEGTPGSAPAGWPLSAPPSKGQIGVWTPLPLQRRGAGHGHENLPGSGLPSPPLSVTIFKRGD